jgi:hypothetical protein
MQLYWYSFLCHPLSLWRRAPHSACTKPLAPIMAAFSVYGIKGWLLAGITIWVWGTDTESGS